MGSMVRAAQLAREKRDRLYVKEKGDNRKRREYEIPMSRHIKLLACVANRSTVARCFD